MLFRSRRLRFASYLNPATMKHAKATRQQLKQHNHRLVLRCVYNGDACTRAALAQITGLAKPTVSDIVSSLIDEGLLTEIGPGESTESGGKRPTLLEFVPQARQVIGMAIDAYQIDAVLAYLDGSVVLRHRLDLNGAQGDAIVALLIRAINALIAQLDAPLMCLCVGVPGLVDSAAGIVRDSAPLDWRYMPLARMLTKEFDVPAYCANSTELVTRAYVAYGNASAANSLVTVLVNHGVEIGMAYRGGIYRHSLNAGALLVGDDSLSDVLGTPAIRRRLHSLRTLFRKTILTEDTMTYLDIRDALRHGDMVAQQLFEEVTDRLAEIYAWIIALIRPDHITLAGEIVEMGERVLDRIRQKVMHRLPPEAVKAVEFSLTETAHSRSAGAVAYALQQESGILA